MKEFFYETACLRAADAPNQFMLTGVHIQGSIFKINCDWIPNFWTQFKKHLQPYIQCSWISWKNLGHMFAELMQARSIEMEQNLANYVLVSTLNQSDSEQFN
jgi:hypothetical protein